LTSDHNLASQRNLLLPQGHHPSERFAWKGRMRESLRVDRVKRAVPRRRIGGTAGAVGSAEAAGPYWSIPSIRQAEWEDSPASLPRIPCLASGYRHDGRCRDQFLNPLCSPHGVRRVSAQSGRECGRSADRRAGDTRARSDIGASAGGWDGGSGTCPSARDADALWSVAATGSAVSRHDLWCRSKPGTTWLARILAPSLS
jgi:hypothetical protein